MRYINFLHTNKTTKQNYLTLTISDYLNLYHSKPTLVLGFHNYYTSFWLLSIKCKINILKLANVT